MSRRRECCASEPESETRRVDHFHGFVVDHPLDQRIRLASVRLSLPRTSQRLTGTLLITDSVQTLRMSCSTD